MPRGRKQLPAEIRGLLDDLAGRPDGWELLLHAPLETLAVLTRVSPRVVEEVRGMLGSGEQRIRLTREMLEARRRSREEMREAGGAEAERHIVDPRELLTELERYPAGGDFLLRGPAESLAVLFDVHPEVVFGARALLEREDGEKIDTAGGDAEGAPRAGS